MGFPPGAPAGRSQQPSSHDSLHTIGALIVFGSLVPALFVVSRRFAIRRERWWALACAIAGIGVLAFFFASSNEEATSVALRAAVLLDWGGASMLAFRLLAAWPRTAPAQRAEASG